MNDPSKLRMPASALRGAEANLVEVVGRLEDDANDAIEQAQRERGDNEMLHEQVVSWDDLHAGATITFDRHGDMEYLVKVSEAAPEAWRFAQYIAQRLDCLGWGSVQVECEW